MANEKIVLVLDHDKDTKNFKRFSQSRDMADSLGNQAFGSVGLPKGFSAERIYVTVSTTMPKELRGQKLPKAVS